MDTSGMQISSDTLKEKVAFELDSNKKHSTFYSLLLISFIQLLALGLMFLSSELTDKICLVILAIVILRLLPPNTLFTMKKIW